MSRTILGYADRFSVAPGEKIAFKASCHGHAHYHLEIVRLISADLNPEGPGFREEVVPSGIAGNYPGTAAGDRRRLLCRRAGLPGPARLHGIFPRRHDLADDAGQGLADSDRPPVAQRRLRPCPRCRRQPGADPRGWRRRPCRDLDRPAAAGAGMVFRRRRLRPGAPPRPADPGAAEGLCPRREPGAARGHRRGRARRGRGPPHLRRPPRSRFVRRQGLGPFQRQDRQPPPLSPCSAGRLAAAHHRSARGARLWRRSGRGLGLRLGHVERSYPRPLPQPPRRQTGQSSHPGDEGLELGRHRARLAARAGTIRRDPFPRRRSLRCRLADRCRLRGAGPSAQRPLCRPAPGWGRGRADSLLRPAPARQGDGRYAVPDPDGQLHGLCQRAAGLRQRSGRGRQRPCARHGTRRPLPRHPSRIRLFLLRDA